MRVLVTGASGLIGSAVCDALLARGDEVAGLSRDPAKARATNPTVSWHAWDPANERPPEAAFEGVDAVVNLVGEEINQRLTDEAKQRIRESRVRATKNLVDGMLAATPGPRTLVSQAAIGIYGDHGEAIVDESTPPAEGFLPQVVVDWEHEARKAESAGVRVVIFRTGLILDPDGGLLKQLVPPFQLGVGGPLAGWRLLHAVDPPRRRGRADPLGARQPAGERHAERDRADARSPTASSRRRSARRCTARRSCPRRDSRSSPCAARSSPSRSPAATG